VGSFAYPFVWELFVHEALPIPGFLSLGLTLSFSIFRGVTFWKQIPFMFFHFGKVNKLVLKTFLRRPFESVFMNSLLFFPLMFKFLFPPFLSPLFWLRFPSRTFVLFQWGSTPSKRIHTFLGHPFFCGPSPVQTRFDKGSQLNFFFSQLPRQLFFLP